MLEAAAATRQVADTLQQHGEYPCVVVVTLAST